nr:hypothetical protein CFP56_75588 [Quercus suber]
MYYDQISTYANFSQWASDENGGNARLASSRPQESSRPKAYVPILRKRARSRCTVHAGFPVQNEKGVSTYWPCGRRAKPSPHWRSLRSLSHFLGLALFYLLAAHTTELMMRTWINWSTAPLLATTSPYHHDAGALRYVNPKIGTYGVTPNGNGGMIPSVSTPFGMTRWTPQTRENFISQCPYNDADRYIHGFQGMRIMCMVEGVSTDPRCST